MARDTAELCDRLEPDPESLSPAQPSRHDAPPPAERIDADTLETLTSMIGG